MVQHRPQHRVTVLDFLDSGNNQEAENVLCYVLYFDACEALIGVPPLSHFGIGIA